MANYTALYMEVYTSPWNFSCWSKCIFNNQTAFSTYVQNQFCTPSLTSLPQIYGFFFNFQSPLSYCFLLFLPHHPPSWGPLLFCHLRFLSTSSITPFCPYLASLLCQLWLSADFRAKRGIYRNQRWHGMADLLNATIHRGHCLAMPESIAPPFII